MNADWRYLGPICAAVVGLFGWFAKHISNTKKHPCKDDIVFKDVCEAKQDCLETEIRNLGCRVGEMKTDMKDGFDRMETLIKNKS